ncbi:hypothetical protein D4764_20G0009310 [Takifugu flavidus]|uniref:Uncharacterized protein n=1 Tax=Takifugu flavidus TaxID=433684 RepID=A0A5C6NJV6_9TELE|nr:hypothetical protein D4764_20G0009310 [Takifugu flavidus]
MLVYLWSPESLGVEWGAEHLATRPPCYGTSSLSRVRSGVGIEGRIQARLSVLQVQSMKAVTQPGFASYEGETAFTKVEFLKMTPKFIKSFTNKEVINPVAGPCEFTQPFTSPRRVQQSIGSCSTATSPSTNL